MPLPNGTPTFEDLVELFSTTRNPVTLATHIGTITAGLADAGSRLRHLEAENIDHMARLTHLEAQQNAFETKVDGFQADRDAYKRAVDTATQIPERNSKRLDDLEKRTRAVEGAVGATTFKPEKPFAPPPANPTPTPPRPTFSEVVGLQPPVAPQPEPV
jgi:chromosome segregation ATPase